MCASVVQIDAINSIKTRRGSQYDKWVAGLLAAAERHAGDLEIDDLTVPPPPSASPGDSTSESELDSLPRVIPPRRAAPRPQLPRSIRSSTLTR